MEAATPEAHPELAALLETLHENAPRWLELGPNEILPLLEETRERTLAVAEAWVEASGDAKGLAPDSPLRGEEWSSGPWAVLAGLNGLLFTLGQIAAGNDPLSGMQVRTRPDGQVLVDVFPANVWDQLLLSGYTATVWQQPGVTKDDLRDHVAVRFREGSQPPPRVGLVLGAGNINSIPPLDALTELVRLGKTCIVKLNPVNDYLEPFLNDAFKAFVDRGFLKFVKGDGAVGAWLTTHALVDTVHITGSARTHDLIVFGPGEEGNTRKADNDPRLTKPISSELGGVGGTIVVPGPWTKADFRFQAEHLVTQKLHNGGFNCVASQVLIVPKGWSGTPRLLDEVKTVLREVLENRPSYYPGTDDRRAVFTEAHPEAATLGDRNPFVMVEGLSPNETDTCFTYEAFGPVFAVAEIEASEPDAFLAAAVDFANDQLAGTLSSQLVIHPTTERKYKAALEQAIADLRFGAIGVNVWSGAAFLLPHATWGAFPGHTIDDVQSGIGIVHNALMFSRSERTI
ncbi:MAG: aldehyde dehydrogenase family protein, partial [Myxococcota bacterium]